MKSQEVRQSTVHRFRHLQIPSCSSKSGCAAWALWTNNAMVGNASRCVSSSDPSHRAVPAASVETHTPSGAAAVPESRSRNHGAQ